MRWPRSSNVYRHAHSNRITDTPDTVLLKLTAVDITSSSPEAIIPNNLVHGAVEAVA